MNEIEKIIDINDYSTKNPSQFRQLIKLLNDKIIEVDEKI